MADEAYLEKLPGIRDIIDATGGGNIILPRSSRLRVKGGGIILTPTPDALEMQLTGVAGAKGAKGDTGDQGVQGVQGPAGSLATIGRLDTTHSPLGLWHFNGDLADSSGNSRTLTVDTGAAVYAELWPGFKGIDLNGTCRLTNSHASFQLTGNCTIEMVCVLNGTPNSIAFVAQNVAGETSATNTLFRLGVTTAARLLQWLTEHGAGVDDAYTLSTAALPPLGVPFHLAVTRTSNVVQFYVNGVAHGPASSALTAPDGGGSTVLNVGGDASNLCGPMMLAELKIIGSALSAPQVLAEAERTIGALY